MIRTCAIVPYMMMWWGDFDVSDMLLVCVVFFSTIGISIIIAKKVIENIFF